MYPGAVELVCVTLNVNTEYAVVFDKGIPVQVELLIDHTLPPAVDEMEPVLVVISVCVAKPMAIPAAVVVALRTLTVTCETPDVIMGVHIKLEVEPARKKYFEPVILEAAAVFTDPPL